MTAHRRAALLFVLVAVGACREIIGIEDASVDPATLPVAAGAGAASAAPGSVNQGATGVVGGNSGTAEAGAGNAAGAPANEGVGGESGQPASGAAGAPGAAGAAGEAPTLCEVYCDELDQSCQGNLAVYSSREMCLAVCAVTPPGSPGDGDAKVDTTECRLEAALAAGISEPAYYCPIAGPGGNGLCGSNCESLCRLRDSVCSPYVLSDHAACLQACQQLPSLEGYSSAPTSIPSYTRGPHVQCRLYHASAAATDDPETHCAHVEGASPCIAN